MTTIEPGSRYRIVADGVLGHGFPVGTIVRAVAETATGTGDCWLVTDDMTWPLAKIDTRSTSNLPGGGRVRWAQPSDLDLEPALVPGDRVTIMPTPYVSPALQVGKTGTVTAVEDPGNGTLIARVLADESVGSGSFWFHQQNLKRITTTTTEQEKPVSTSQQGKTAAEVQAEFDAFKAKVTQVARRYAKEYEWCSVVDSALEEMGLPYPKRYLVDVTYTVAITADDEDAAERRVRYLVDGLNYSGQGDDEAFDEDAIGRQVGNVRLEG